MPHPLTEIEAIEVPVESYLGQVGEVFQAFRQQDSGTVSYGVLIGERRWFVKESGNPSIVESLRRALRLHTKVQHPALPRLRSSFRTPGGLALVYEWVPGEVLHDPRFTREQRRWDPAHPHVRFRSLPVGEILEVLDTIFDVHVLLAGRGFVASDFYDGCIIYDFVGRRVSLCDLDEYREGPFVLELDRNYGSTRFMAPEEFRRGSTIDQVTNVFSLGRAATVLLCDGTESLDAWRGSDALREVVVRATTAERSQRHQSVREFVEEWHEAAQAG
jgi:serine/threonine-protein kinase